MIGDHSIAFLSAFICLSISVMLVRFDGSLSSKMSFGQHKYKLICHRIGMIGTDGDPVSSIELGDNIIVEADVCSQSYASFLGRAFRQHSDGLCTYMDD